MERYRSSARDVSLARVQPSRSVPKVTMDGGIPGRVRVGVGAWQEAGRPSWLSSYRGEGGAQQRTLGAHFIKQRKRIFELPALHRGIQQRAVGVLVGRAASGLHRPQQPLCALQAAHSLQRRNAGSQGARLTKRTSVQPAATGSPCPRHESAP